MDWSHIGSLLKHVIEKKKVKEKRRRGRRRK
jgi:hypothetical protein